MNADTFNNKGGAVDNSSAPIINASVKGVWQEIEANKIAAGKKFANHRLMFKDESIEEFSGDAANPQINFVGKTEEYLVHSVTASFLPTDGEKIGTLKKGAKISFVCEEISETFGDGYSLAKCSLR